MTHNIYLFFFNRNPENISILEMSIGIGVYCIFIVGNSLWLYRKKKMKNYDYDKEGLP